MQEDLYCLLFGLMIVPFSFLLFPKIYFNERLVIPLYVTATIVAIFGVICYYTHLSKSNYYLYLFCPLLSLSLLRIELFFFRKKLSRNPQNPKGTQEGIQIVDRVFYSVFWIVSVLLPIGLLAITSSARDSKKLSSTTQSKNIHVPQGLKAKLLFGQADTFNIDNRRFRLRFDTSIDSIIIEYYGNGEWIKNVALKMYDEFETDTDLNDDGYKDITSEAQGWNFINFYNPSKGLFSKQYQLPGDNEVLLDTVHKLYINYRKPYHQCNNYSSQLMNYTNGEPTIHYVLSGETYSGKDGCIIDSIKLLKLYRFDSIKDTLIFLEVSKPKNPKVFDYSGFWKKNYKRLMGYN